MQQVPKNDNTQNIIIGLFAKILIGVSNISEKKAVNNQSMQVIITIMNNADIGYNKSFMNLFILFVCLVNQLIMLTAFIRAFFSVIFGG